MKKLYLIIVAVIAVFVGYSRLVEAEESVSFEMFDKCKNVTFRVTNNRNVAIEVKQIKYYNASKGKWKTENVANGNQRCERGSTCIIGGGWGALTYQNGEDLGDAEGDRLTKIVFVYQDVNSNTNHESQQFTPSDPACRFEKEYGHGQGWAITGTSDAGSQNSSGGLGDECKNVSFLVRNNTNNILNFTKVKYFNRNSGNWKTENVSSVRCLPGENCTIGGTDDLGDARDEDLTKIIFVYEVDSSNQNKESRTFNPSSPKCTEGKVYGTGQGWAIGNATGSLNRSVTNSTSSGSTSTSTDPNPTNRPVMNANKNNPNRRIRQSTTAPVVQTTTSPIVQTIPAPVTQNSDVKNKQRGKRKKP